MKTSSIKIFGRRVISIYNHHIMSLTYDDRYIDDHNLRMICVTHDADKMISGTYSVPVALDIVRTNLGLCEVFVFVDDHDNTVGTLSVMFKGGKDYEYRINNIDAYIYNVCVVEQYRGKGLVGGMIALLMQHLHKMSIDKAYLAVSTNNTSAIRAYEKIGFVYEKDLSFLRAFRVNIPNREL